MERNKLVIDISHHNGLINFGRVKKTGVKGIIHKVLEGQSAVDGMFRTNLPAMLREDFYVGGYHFIRNDGYKEAIRFCSLVQGLEKIHACRIFPAIDAEAQNLTLYDLIKQSEVFCDFVVNTMGVYPLFYINRSQLWQYENEKGFEGSVLTKCPLWIARYNSSLGSLPPHWKNYTLWQYTDSGRVEGVSGDVDLNDFSGNDLKYLFTGQAQAVEGKEGDASGGAKEGTSPEI